MTTITDNGFARISKETLILDPSNAGALYGGSIAYDSSMTLNEKISTIPGGALDVEAGGIVVTPTGNLTSNNVQDALEELQTELDTFPGINAAQDVLIANRIPNDGWVSAGETWTYASATTLTISGDLTTKYQRGDRIKLTQATINYFTVLKVSYGAPNTTITITGGTDYTLVSAAISLNYYSKVVSPQGYPDWFNYTVVPTGFSVNPTVAYAKFRIVGSTITQCAAFSGNGTSNTTALTVGTIGSVTANGEFLGHSGYSVDNGADIASGPYCFIANGASSITCAKAHNSTTWTAANGKRSNFNITYQFTL